MNKLFRYFPLWGPYSKKYAGISKITNHSGQSGSRFDFLTAPAIMGLDIKVPNVTLPSAYHPWLSSKNYSFYSFRHDLEWKDVIYADVSYTKLSDESTLVRTEIVNNGDIVKNFVVNYFASIEFPFDSYTEAVFPQKCDMLKASQYSSYNYAITRPWDEQNADGRKKGVFLDNRFLYGEGLGDRAEKWHMPHKVLRPFGGEKGDSATFSFKLKHKYKNAVLTIRYRTSDIEYIQGKMTGVSYINSKNTAEFLLSGKKIALSACDDLNLFTLDLGEINTDEFKFNLVSCGTGAAEFDFFAICEKEDAEKIQIRIPL